MTCHVLCGLMVHTIGPCRLGGQKRAACSSPHLLAALLYNIELHTHSGATSQCATHKSCSSCGHSCTPHQTCWGGWCTHCSLACTGAPLQRQGVPTHCSCGHAGRSQSLAACKTRVCGAQAGTGGAHHDLGPVLPAEKRRTLALKVVICLLLAALCLAAGLAHAAALDGTHIRDEMLASTVPGAPAWGPCLRNVRCAAC